MGWKRRSLCHLFAMLAFLLCKIGIAGAGQPTEQIRSAIDKGVQILNRAKLDNEKERAKVIEQLREIVYPLFDFEEMARRSLGPHWRGLSPEQRKEFVAVFTQLLENTYADGIDLYEGQQVFYRDEVIDNNFATVRTRIVGKANESYSVDYRLHLVNGEWRIYDIVTENVSVVNNYRSQFHRVIVRSSFEDLLNRMKKTLG